MIEGKVMRVVSCLCFVSLAFIAHVHAASMLVVLRENVNVRSEPNVNSELLVRLNSGHKLKEIRKKGYWYEVEPVGISQIRGWVFGSLVGAADAYTEPREPKGGLVVAQMGNEVLFEEEFHSFLALLDPATRSRMRRDQNLLKNMVREEMLRKKVLQEAMAAEFDLSPRIVRFMERARAQALADHFLSAQAQAPDGYPSNEKIKETYDLKVDEYTIPQRLHVAHIFIDVPADLEEGTREVLRDKAREISHLARFGGSDFTTLAAEYSEQRATAQAGGDLGWLEEDAVSEGMRQVLAEMEIDSVSAPYRSAQGWHIFKLKNRQKSRLIPLSEVAEEIRENLRRRKMVANRELYLKNLMARDEIILDEGTLKELIQSEVSPLFSQP